MHRPRRISLLWMILKLSLKNIWANKLRSSLTMLGIIIGVSSVIAMMALSHGAREAGLQEFRRWGIDTLAVEAVFRGTTDQRKKITLEDCRAILKDAPTIKAFSPDINASAQLKYGNKKLRTSLHGVSSAFPAMRRYQLASGRIFTEAEERLPRKITVIGHKIVKDLFRGNPDSAVGRQIKINSDPYVIVGALAEKGATGGWNPDDMILVPYTTAMKRVGGGRDFWHVSLHAKSEEVMAEAKEEVIRIMRREHKIKDPTQDDFVIWSPTEELKQFDSQMRFFTVLIAGIAGISLLVGGIGIMNIMLVTVTERTREIGIRKALGARRRDIQNQFLIESLAISFTGGVIGVLIGMSLASLFNIILSGMMGTGRNYATVSVSANSVVMALSFCLFIGLFFGIYPARKAAKLDPIEALRHE